MNDLGWVAYQNDNFVLDLVGLGSEEARRMRAVEGNSPASIGRLTEKNGIKYAMVYDSWFGAGLPGAWCRIAVLRTSQVTAASGEVAFYLIDRSLFREMQAKLGAFQASLPSGATLAILSCAD